MTEQTVYAHLLHEGESILWEGKPEESCIIPRRMLLYLLFTLLLMALAFAPWDGRSWGSFFAAMVPCSAFIIAGYIVMAVQARRRAKRERYLVTDRRVMILVPESTGLRLQDVKLLRNIRRIRTQREGKGCVTIYIGPQTQFEHFALLVVPDGEAVAELIRSLSSNAAGTFP